MEVNCNEPFPSVSVRWFAYSCRSRLVPGLDSQKNFFLSRSLQNFAIFKNYVCNFYSIQCFCLMAHDCHHFCEIWKMFFVVVSNVRLHESPFIDLEPDNDEIEKKSL